MDTFAGDMLRNERKYLDMLCRPLDFSFDICIARIEPLGKSTTNLYCLGMIFHKHDSSEYYDTEKCIRPAANILDAFVDYSERCSRIAAKRIYLVPCLCAMKIQPAVLPVRIEVYTVWPPVVSDDTQHAALGSLQDFNSDFIALLLPNSSHLPKHWNLIHLI